MADKTITELNPLVTPASTDVLAIVDVAGNETKKIEVGNLVDSGVTDVTATAPITSSGGATPDIGITAASTSAAGSMSAADKTKLDGIAPNAQTGTVTEVATGTGLTGGPITATGTIDLANTTVTPGSYTSADITVDAQGRITAAANGGGGGGGANNVMIPWGFFDSNVRDVYVPITTETENTSRQRYNRFVVPFDGSLKACTFMTTGNLSGGTGFSLELHQMTGASTWNVLETQSLQGLSAYVTSTMTFSSNSFSAGDVLYFWLTNGMGVAFGNLSGTLLFEVS